MQQNSLDVSICQIDRTIIVTVTGVDRETADAAYPVVKRLLGKELRWKFKK